MFVNLRDYLLKEISELTFCSSYKEICELLHLIEEFEYVVKSTAEQLQFPKDILLAESELPTLPWGVLQALLKEECLTEVKLEKCIVI